MKIDEDQQLSDKKLEIVTLCKNLLKKKFIRSDYKELVQLVLCYLGEQKLTKFNRPGAIHKARFMSKLLSSLKIVMLREDIKTKLAKNAIFTDRQLDRLQKFVKFAVYCYIPWWLTCAVPSHAPQNDLNFLKTLKSYEGVDAVSAKAATKAFSRHLWYVTEELAILGLFCSSVSAETKEAMRKILLQKAKDDPSRGIWSSRFGMGFGKPSMPKVTEELTDGDLSQFITPNSRNFFENMKLSDAFLEQPVSEWESHTSYRHAKTIVNHLHVVNDGCERSVKLAQECLGKAKKETKNQNIIQVIENDRKKRSNQRILKEPKE